MLFQVISCRQAVLLDIVLCGDWNEMELPELSKPDVRRLGRTEADHDIRLVFPQAHDVDRALQMHLDLRIPSRKLIESGRSEQRVQTVRNADTDDAFGLAGLRLQVAGDRIERVIEPAQGLRERLSFWGQL